MDQDVLQCWYGYQLSRHHQFNDESIQIIEETTKLRRDILFRTHDQWKDIDERRLMSDDDDYMKAKNMKSHQLGSKRTIKDEQLSFLVGVRY